VTAVYAVTLVAGFVLILLWVAAVAVAESVPGWQHVDPERRFGRNGRLAVAALIGFGLGGMSSSFAGWPDALAALGALGGALLSGTGAWFLAGSGDTGAP
jgi:hypothetical protein